MTVPFGQTVVLKPHTGATTTLVNVPVCPREAAPLLAGLTALLPPDTVVTAIDTVTVGGADYAVDGEPGRFESPFTGVDPGVLVNLIRGLLVDVVSLRAPGTSSVWNEVTHRTETTPNAPFATGVPARIVPQTASGSNGAEKVTADDAVHVAGYIVSLPLNATGVSQIVVNGESDTLVDVTSSVDPLLVGRTLRVVDIVRGSTQYERTLLCTLND